MISNNFYVDDFLAGADTLEEACALQEAVHAELESAGFPLRKYSSNSQLLLDRLHPELVEPRKTVKFSSEACISTLGLKWNPSSDTFGVQSELPDLPELITKRVILSYISRQFDPLGFLTPVTIRAKIMLQDLWREGLSWDQPVSPELSGNFRKYWGEIEKLTSFSIRRSYSELNTVTKKYLIGFCDASPQAYCAVVYLRCEDDHGNVSNYSVCSRTRVAPLKALTIPRLELQGALLLAELMVRIRQNLKLDSNKLLCFSDSMIVLGWLNKPAENWQVFVRNRVLNIIALVDRNCWFHVNGSENPADLATRGIAATSLFNNKLWLVGPELLKLPIEDLKKLQNLEFEECTLPEAKFCQLAMEVPRLVRLEHISSYNKLLNIVCYLLRFSKRTRDPSQSQGTYIHAEEREHAFCCVVRYVQSQHFKAELSALSGNCRKSLSAFKTFTPFLDENEVLRVGGRLGEAYSFNKRHPILIPANSWFFRLYVTHVHSKYYHASKLFLTSYIRNLFWPIGGLSRILKSVIFSCVTCKRFRAETYEQLMGQLPMDRVTVARAFATTGVDFAGPFSTRCTTHRTHRYNKSCIAVFVCFVTRAVHIEVVSDLTATAFIASLRRFIARRGLPKRLYSDNATNFVGAKNLIIDNEPDVRNFVAKEGIRWTFIPPRAPHHGGLWKAAVKSMKFHLVRTSSGTNFSFEELSTVVAQIESILNDRPLCYRSLPNDDFCALTPAHFLVGSTLQELPGEEKMSKSLGQRWLEMRRIVAAFWTKWRADYLSQLQVKSKWTKLCDVPKVGDVVVIKEENGSPFKWPLGRIVETYPDKQGLVRVVDVRTANGPKRRSIVKLVPLLVDTNVF